MIPTNFCHQCEFAKLVTPTRGGLMFFSNGNVVQAFVEDPEELRRLHVVCVLSFVNASRGGRFKYFGRTDG